MARLRLYFFMQLVLMLCASGFAQDLLPTANTPTVSTVPRLVLFNGTIPGATGTLGTTFALYANESGGAPLWLETQNVSVDQNGRFTVYLGANHANGIPADVFASGDARWLGIQPDGQPEQKRVLLVSVPYALQASNADTLGGLTAAQIVAMTQPAVAVLPGSERTSVTTYHGPRPAGYRDLPYVPAAPVPGPRGSFFLNESSQVVVEAYDDNAKVPLQLLLNPRGGNLGIGTSVPTSKLTVAGAVESTTGGFKFPDGTVQTTAGTGDVSSITPADTSIAIGGTTASPTVSVATGGIGTTKIADAAVTDGKIASVSGSKVTGAVATATNATTVTNGLYTTGTYANPSWLTSLDGGKISGTVANAAVATNALALKGAPASSFATIGANSFSGTQTITNGNLALPQTTDSTTGVLTLGDSPFLHACCAAIEGNTFVGNNAGNLTTTGSYNTATGNGALGLNQDGSTNTASGYQALQANTTGFGNTATGSQALYSNNTGIYNTAVGQAALFYTNRFNNAGAAFNTAVGFNSGVSTNYQNANVSGYNNTFIGAFSGPGTSTQLNNATAIGYGALVSSNNSLVLGGTGTYAVNVGIGTPTPLATLDVAGDGKFAGSVTAASFSGNGANLTGINATTVTNGVYVNTANSFTAAQTITTAAGTTSLAIGGGSIGLNASGSTVGVEGFGEQYGVYGGTFDGFGVYGYAQERDGTGVYGNGGMYGVKGKGPTGVYGTGGTGLYGSGSMYGVYGTATDSSGYGVWAANTSATGINAGVYGTSASGSGYGVYGNNSSGGYGVHGSGNVGVYGSGSNTGVYGTSNTYAVFGQSSTGYAGWFAGNVYVTGTLSKSGGSFKIDHPLDPANKYLYHSFVESPDMMNIYNGNVTLGANGEAWVTLPDWFEALNRDFRYQLTSIGAFMPVYIAEKISGNRFKIAGGLPDKEVSWQVTGVRQDAWANAHRIPVEEEKQGPERGTYLHPELVGQPDTMSVTYKHTTAEHRTVQNATP